MSRGKFVLAVVEERMEVQEVYPVAVAAVAEENKPKSNQKSNFVQTLSFQSQTRDPNSNAQIALLRGQPCPLLAADADVVEKDTVPEVQRTVQDP
jgi:hypothetical protein